MKCPDCDSELIQVTPFSTTQLINGTKLEYLKLTCPYYIDPDSRAFMMYGTIHHQVLDEVAKKLGLPSEIPLSIDRDIFDLIEFEEEEIVLTDYKLWGSFKVALVLGIEEAGKEPDPSGAVYKVSGRWGKAGTPKMIPVFRENPNKADNWEAELQLNRYRILLEELGIKITKLQLQVTVRDGGLYIAKERGIVKNIYKVPVKILDNQEVKRYFAYKSACLKGALAGEVVPPCNNQESWEGIRCKGFCDVAAFCSRGQLIKSLEIKE